MKRFIKNNSAALFVSSLGYQVTPHTKTIGCSLGCGCEECGGSWYQEQQGFLVAATQKQLIALGVKSSAGTNTFRYYSPTFGGNYPKNQI